MNTGIRKFLFFVLIVGMMYVAYKYIIKPANESLAIEKKKVEEKRTRLLELEKANAAASDIARQLEKVQQAIKDFENKLPNASDVHMVLEDVTIIAQKHGLVPKTIKTLKQKESSGYFEQPLKMELYGNFKEYYAFLLELEKLDRITRIRQLSINKSSVEEGCADVTFEVSVFFQGEKTKKPSLAMAKK